MSENGPGRDAPALFATLAVAIAAIVAVVVLVQAFRSSPSDLATSGTSETAGGASETQVIDLDDGAIADPNADPSEIAMRAAAAMAEVRSVEFTVERDGAAIFIDQFASIALDRIRGQFTVPTRAQAELTVTIDNSLTTKLGAVAIEDEVWISNPVTGDFETLPAGYDIDPSRFFDPRGGWQPLLANLRDVELIGIEDDGGDRYHLRGTATAADVRNVTVGLVRDQDVPVDLWIHPTTWLATRAEFETVIGGVNEWAVTLDRYGATFRIEPPENVRDGG